LLTRSRQRHGVFLRRFRDQLCGRERQFLADQRAAGFHDAADVQLRLKRQSASAFLAGGQSRLAFAGADEFVCAGLGTNWVTVASSNTTNQMMFPVGTGNGSAFFRLVYP